MTVWSRGDTKEWIIQLEHRIEDIDYHLTRTIEWCENNGIWNDETVFACALLTVVWVSHMRCEPISKREALEILRIEDWEKAPEEILNLGPTFSNYDLEEMLEEVVKQM